MRGGGLLPVRGAIANAAMHNNQRGTILAIEKGLVAALHEIEIVRIRHALHVPAVGEKARRDVFGECDVGVMSSKVTASRSSRSYDGSAAFIPVRWMRL